MMILRKIKIEKNRLILAVSVGIILSFILGFGGYSQNIFINILFSESSSLYDTLTTSGCFIFTKPLTFIEWMKGLYSPLLLILSIINCYVAFQFKNTRRLLFFISIGTFLTLSVNDTYMHFMYPEFQDSLLESYLCNAVGSLIIAICICIILFLINRASELVSIPVQVSNIIFSFLLGAFVFLILFVLIKNLFWNTQSTISGFMSPPFHGNYSTVSDKIDTEKERFGFLTKQKIGLNDVTWTGEFSNMSLETKHPAKTANVSLFLLEGCFKKDTKDILKSLKKPNFSNFNVSSTNVSIDDGAGSFSIYSKDSNDGFWGITADNIINFNLDLSKKKNKLNLRFDSFEGANFFHKDWVGEVIYRLDVVMADDKKPVSRKISINTHDKVATYTFNISETLEVDKALNCKSIETSNQSIHSQSPFLTALIRISYPRIKTLKDINETPQTNIHGLRGWFAVNDIPKDALSNYVSNGDLNMLSIVGGFDELYIDKEKQEKRKSSWLYMKDGVLSGKSDKGSFDFEGKSDTALLNGERITKTRWERISAAIWWLIILIPSVLTMLLNSFRKCWINDEQLIKL